MSCGGAGGACGGAGGACGGGFGHGGFGHGGFGHGGFGHGGFGGGACGGGGFAGGGFAGGYAGGESRPARKVKVVKNEHRGEKRVVVKDHTTIDENITQPDLNRQALFVVATAAKLGGIRYTYGDELPKKITQATVCAVIFSVIATPLTLICIIPMILKLKKAQQLLAEGSLSDAWEHYKRSNTCFVCTVVWISFWFILLVGSGIFLGTFLGLFLN